MTIANGIANGVANTVANRVAKHIGPDPDPDPDLKLEVQRRSYTADPGSFRSGEPDPSIRSAPTRLGIYFRIIDDLLTRERFTTLSDLVEASKRRCARLRVPYDGGQIQEAVSRMSDRRIGLVEAPTLATTTTRRADTRPLTRAEARAILEDLGITVREIPR